MDVTRSSMSKYFKPRKYCGPNSFTLLCGLIIILQGAYFTYFVGVLTTLERRYAFGTTIMGVILLADNLSPLLFSIPVGHYAKTAHRPKMLTVGMTLTALSCFLCCVPYFIYGSGLSYTGSKPGGIVLCNSTIHSGEVCNLQELSQRSVAICILFVANFLNGCGSVAYYTVGVSFVDDSVSKRRSPLYLGAIFAVKQLGPTLGLYISSFTLSLYENPTVDPGFRKEDARWIGAWWLGFLILGLSLIIVTLPIPCFPRRFQNSSVPDARHLSLKERFQDLKDSLMKLIKNKTLVFHTMSTTLQINGIYAYFIYMPKYMESQYGQTASRANLFSGTTSLFTLIAGVFLGAILIHQIKPKPRYLVGYMVFIELFATAGLISALFLGCPSHNIVGFNQGAMSLNRDCNSHCGCKDTYDPVCVSGNNIHYSPCHAGCQQYYQSNDTTAFFNCSCILPLSSDHKEDAQRGYCHSDCHNFLPYFVILTVSKVLLHTARVGNFLIRLRCVPEEDKALGLGAVEFVISIFATVPHPLVYGYFIDSACLVWEENCGRRGNCRLYDAVKLKNVLHSMPVACIAAASICELFVFYFSKDMKDIYGRDDPENYGLKKEENAEEVPLK